MNNPNPFVPQGSLLEQKNKKRARFKVAVYSILALNILVLTPLLIQGCSKKDDQAANQPVDTGSAPTAMDTNQPTPPLPPMGSNATPTTASNAVVSEPAPPPPPPPPPPAPQTQEYVVTKGDTYYSIGKKLGLKISEIKAANPTVNPAKLKVGQKLQIPAGGGSTGGTGTVAGADAGGDVYVVKSGDSLTKIAKANGVSVKSLKAANELKSDRIKVGEKLKLPAKAAAPADTTPAAAPATTASTSAPTTVPAPGVSGH